MRVTKSNFIRHANCYEIEANPIPGRTLKDFPKRGDDCWYLIDNRRGNSIVAFVPADDGVGYEEIVVDETHDLYERTSDLTLFEVVKFAKQGVELSLRLRLDDDDARPEPGEIEAFKATSVATPRL